MRWSGNTCLLHELPLPATLSSLPTSLPCKHGRLPPLTTCLPMLLLRLLPTALPSPLPVPLRLPLTLCLCLRLCLRLCLHSQWLQVRGRCLPIQQHHGLAHAIGAGPHKAHPAPVRASERSPLHGEGTAQGVLVERVGGWEDGSGVGKGGEGEGDERATSLVAEGLGGEV